MKRRAFVLAAGVWPAFGLIRAARAQSLQRARKPARVAFLSMGSGKQKPRSAEWVAATLAELGWVEGRDVTYDVVYAQGDRSRLPALAEELVARKPDVIHVMANPEALAVLSKTRSIPIVFAVAIDPVEVGLVQSFGRPGGNVTGVTTVGAETGAKRMQLLKELLPKIRRVAVLMSASPVIAREFKLLEQAAGPGVRVISAMASDLNELDAALALIADSKAEAVVITQVAFYSSARKRILALAEKLRIPVIATRDEWADDGALMSYNASMAEQVRRSAQLVDKVLRGTKPADIPVEQPTKFELVVNVKAAKALGIAIPQSVLLQAGRVIE